MKQGYKQTEIGVIPEDWGVIPFSKCFDTINNNTLSRAELNYDGGKIRNIHYGDVLINFPSIVDCQKETIPYVNEDAADGVGNSFLQDGDVVIADTAEDNTVGKAVEIFNIGDSKVVAGLHTMPCRPKNKFADKYLGYYINARVFHDQIIPFITGTKVSSISKKAIDDTTVLVPPFAEQKRIAEALSDVDELIASLEKLIEKKKALKQGVMQELLTGKRRLPGFTGEWETKRIKDIGIQIEKGQILTQQEATIGSIPVVAGGRQPAYYCDTFNRSGVNITISASGASAGFVNLYDGHIFASDCSTIGESPSYNIIFVYNALLNIQQKIYSVQTGGAQPHVHPSELYNLELYYTFDVQEQTEIASILSDIENEIVAKERELQKYRKLKSGMMSELLTGRIRLM